MPGQHGSIPISRLQEGEFDTVIIATPDLAGRLVGKRLPLRHFLAGGRGGLRACDVIFGWGIGHELLEGLASVGWDMGYGDVLLAPDLDTLRPMGWWPRTAIVLADATRGSGEAFPIAPRAILRNQVDAARQHGLEPLVASELEFTVFDESPRTLVDKGYTQLSLHQLELHPELVETIDLDVSLISDVVAGMEASGIPIEAAKAEYSPSQFEITLAPSSPLEAADRHVLYKLGVREIARSHGLAATFMAKWHEGFGGSSCHVHVSFTDAKGRNVFAEGDDERLRPFIGGLQRYAPDLFLLWAPYPNSYKRFRPGTFAPASLSWGTDNRTATFRVTGDGSGRHLENRIPGADVNPYLAYAALLAGGLAGMDEGLQPFADVGHDNAYAKADLPQLPETIEAAIDRFVTSDFCRRVFGDLMVDHVANMAEQEALGSRKAVTDWDRRRLFNI